MSIRDARGFTRIAQLLRETLHGAVLDPAWSDRFAIGDAMPQTWPVECQALLSDEQPVAP